MEIRELGKGRPIVDPDLPIPNFDETGLPDFLEGTVHVNGGQAKACGQIILGQRKIINAVAAQPDDVKAGVEFAQEMGQTLPRRDAAE